MAPTPSKLSMKLILRNDDVCAATTARHLQRFTELTDKYGYQVIHAITPRGVCWASDSWLGSKWNSEIYALGVGVTIEQNPELIEFLLSRRDVIAMHGLWHTHRPRPEEWAQSYQILTGLGLEPTYLVPPFNEGSFKSHNFVVSDSNAWNFEQEAMNSGPIANIHSWRFDPELWQGSYKAPWWTWETLEERLQYPVMRETTTNYQKHRFLSTRIKGRWLDIGCNRGALLDMVPNGVGVDSSAVPLKPGMIRALAESLPFADNSFETSVLCGVLEQCANWREVLAEAQRVTSGSVIGTMPYPGTPYGTLGYTQWVNAVIEPSEFSHTERINPEHYYFEVTKC